MSDDPLRLCVRVSLELTGLLTRWRRLQGNPTGNGIDVMRDCSQTVGVEKQNCKVWKTCNSAMTGASMKFYG